MSADLIIANGQDALPRLIDASGNPLGRKVGLIDKPTQITAYWRHPYTDVQPQAASIEAGGTLLDLVLAMPNLPDRFLQIGTVLINGNVIDRRYWKSIRPKPYYDGNRHNGN